MSQTLSPEYLLRSATIQQIAQSPSQEDPYKSRLSAALGVTPEKLQRGNWI